MSQKHAGSSKSSQPLVHTPPTPAHQGEAAFAGILPFVRFLRYQLKLPTCLCGAPHCRQVYLAGMAAKDKGYRVVSLTLILLCRPQLNCASINSLRALMVQRFIQRVFSLSYGKQRGASVDILPACACDARTQTGMTCSRNCTLN